MALELRQALTLSQQLIMTPQLQQAIKLLQLSRLELLETINQEMEENPVLEEQILSEADEDGRLDQKPDESKDNAPDLPEVTMEERVREDVDWDNYLSEYNSGWAESPYEERVPPPFENITSVKTNLCSHLMWQLNMSNMGQEQKEVACYIIGNLDEDGYLDTPIEEISQTTGCSEDKVLETLHLVQNFDPVGVAARDTRECLLIQVRFLNLEGTIVEKIIMNHLRDLENRRYEQIAKRLSVSVHEVIAALTVLQGLEPKPGRIYSDEETIYITPDIYVFKVGDDYEIVQNEDGLPKLRINAYYREILRSTDSLSENAKLYIQEKLRSAAWLIKSIHQRQRTIYKVTESIVRFQKNFLDNGITHLKPLVLRDVAEDIQMHESTVSRVTTNKYVYTPQGAFELKFFFNSSISSVIGDAVASESVKADILKKFNIDVARRTVAKYRESMGILPSRKRKAPY
jgi:RNA polymerase sigma-54 factor